MAQRIDNRILDALVCPCCGAPLGCSDNGKSLLCSAPRRHCFDFSADGYVNLATAHHGGGDSKQAVRSRTEFLESGAYEPVSDAVNKILCDFLLGGGLVVDAGCGEGYYSCRAAENSFDVIGFDLSKDGVAQAAKRARRKGLSNTFFGVGSVYAMPLRDKSADAVINIFAPCAEEEYCRLLKDGGILAVAYAGREHLMGLKRQIYDTVYENEERADMPRSMKLVEERRVRFDLTLRGSAQIMALFSMTPYYWRTSPEDKNKLLGVEELTTEVDIIIAIYKKEI
ncbi:MAG: methyltransferase domain-containing protein [Ruminococcaceae bacterium]|nr:methyltransferase domain-containing protein [Oscillospiraceae bacterium]